MPALYEQVDSNEYFLLARIESLQEPLPLKHVLPLVKLVRLLIYKNSVRGESFGSILKSPIIK